MQVRTKATPVWSSEEITYLREFFVALLPAAAGQNGGVGVSAEGAIAGAMNAAGIAVKAFMAEKGKMQA